MTAHQDDLRAALTPALCEVWNAPADVRPALLQAMQSALLRAAALDSADWWRQYRTAAPGSIRPAGELADGESYAEQRERPPEWQWSDEGLLR